MLNAFVWGVSWWPFRELQGHGLHPLWATALIYLVSMALLLARAPARLGGFRGQPALWLLLAAAGMTNVGFNWAVTVGDVVRVVLLFYLMPAWTVVLAWPLLGERPTPLGAACGWCWPWPASCIVLEAGRALAGARDASPTGWRWRAASASR